ncbi:hypothetical protein [Bowmanella yangjiangensis]|uniref:Peptidase M61 catalytic domain-containing protein n=1 Tax=Bowmanella yangjiangensis TaxID=2811230 RepID=A0ABS3CS75_9ALTE|nr:hypothetical protein [Bowmanella yangjiangensis]MBN7819962.1 hypothetical protein [Bowmanella yangjiangensis]
MLNFRLSHLITWRWILGICLFSAITQARQEADVAIQIEKSLPNSWILTYQTTRPASRLAFVRNPDASRTQRWQPLQSDFEIIYEQDEEFIKRKDNSPFTQVSLRLTPTYKHLSKDYAPFSPYSDGGNLIYTGRLFACIERCTSDINGWSISLTIPPNEHMLLAGQVISGEAHWQDYDDGRNVYVGNQMPIITSHVIAQVDSGLPPQLQGTLAGDIPAFMDFFAAKLGKLMGEKPMLFASYAKVKDGSAQGGTLPNQIFMHWNRDDLSAQDATPEFQNNTLWFFAHEVAHLYQHGSQEQVYADAEASWLHEGHADYLASQALLAQHPQLADYVSERFAKARTSCQKGLAQIGLHDAAEQGQFHLYYSCGMLIHQAIDRAWQNNSADKLTTFDLWQDYRKRVGQGQKAGAVTFWQVAKQYLPAPLYNQLLGLTEQKLDDPKATLKMLTE